MTEYSMMTGRNENGIGHAENERCKTNEAGAAVIVHSRTRYRDFREGLLVRPVDMSEEQVYRWKKQLLRCTREPEEMRAGHQVRRAVMGDGVYGAVGVAAYFRDVATGSFEDEGRRPAYGFVGFLWKIDSAFRPSAFPSMGDFRDLTERYVVPRWEEPKNGRDTEKATLSAYRECWNGMEPADLEAAVGQALERAVRGEKVFFCAGLAEQTPEPDFDAVRNAGEKMKATDETSDQGERRGLIRIAVIAGLLCGVVIWILAFR